MANYVERVKDNSFLELQSDPEFQKDLVQFFSGGRYNKTIKEMIDLGVEGLTEEFVTHMRYQAANEVTAIKDLNYANSKSVSRKGKESFGNLLQAWDNSDRVGDDWYDNAGDYLEATMTAPSTYIGLGSFGVGKLGAKAAASATQMLVRSSLSSYIKKNAAIKAASIAAQRGTANLAAKAVANPVKTGIAAGFVTEASLGALTSGSAGETREELIEGYDYSGVDLAVDAGIQGVFGSALGAAGGFISKRKAVNKEVLASEMSAANVERVKVFADRASETIKNTSKAKVTPERAKRLRKIRDFAAKRTIDLEATLAARAGDNKARVTDPDSKDFTNMGESILRGLENTDLKGTMSSGLSMDTIRSITAATIDIADQFDLGPTQRITSAIAKKLDGSVDAGLEIKKLELIRKKYGLSKEQMSYVYLADVSRAGKILAEQSKISRAVRDAGGAARQGKKLDPLNKSSVLEGDDILKQAEAGVASVNVDILTLAARGLSTFNDTEAAEIAAAVVKNSGTTKTKGVYNFLKDFDGMRIAFMTSQIATTSRNATSTSLFAGVDMLDELNRSLIRGTKGALRGDFSQANIKGLGSVARRMSSNIRGLSYNNGTAEVLRETFREQMPEAYTNAFYNTLRMEVGTQSNSNMAKAGRLVNFVNTSFDTAFKEAAMFASLERKLIDLGDDWFKGKFNYDKLEKVNVSVEEFLKKGGRLDDLPPGTMEKAVDDANRFTMQRTYANDDSYFGKIARNVTKANQKVPFLISAALGVPFPRYVANHIEMIVDYTPVVGSVIPLLKKAGVNIAGDQFKSTEDRMARQLTSISLLGLGYGIAKAKGGQTDYSSVESSLGGQSDIAPSVGFLIAPMFLGDLVYRWSEGLPPPASLGKELLEVMGGLGDMSVDFSLPEAAIDSFAKREFTEQLQKSLGNVFSTLSYPFTLARDIQGQFSYESAGTPFVRDLGENSAGIERGTRMEDLKKSMKGERSTFEVFKGQSTRMFMDLDSVQYTQSFTENPGNDINYYSPFNSQPVGKMNPLLKQFTGVQQNPPMTSLQREMNRMNLEEYEVYGSSDAPNATVDYQLRYNLSKTLPQKFNTWTSEVPIGGRGGDLTYVELTKENLGPDATESDLNAFKREALDKFINYQITEEREKVRQYFEERIISEPVKIRGYIRNNYVLKKKEIGGELFDEVVSNMEGSEFSTAEQFLADSEDVKEELNRRTFIVERAARLKKRYELTMD